MTHSASSRSWPDRLVDIEQIRQLKARYCRLLDTKRWQDLRALFAPDCRFEGMGNYLPNGAGPDTFVEFVQVRHARTVSVHHCHTPEIEFTGDHEARAVWAMEDFVEWQDLQDVAAEWQGYRGFRGYGHYEEAYRRIGDQWRIALVRLTRLRLDGVPLDAPPARAGALKASPDWIGSR